MSRQKSNGLGYFPLDVDFFEKDKRIRRLIGRFDASGALLFIYILCKIYEHSYYIICDDDFIDDAAADLLCTKEKIGLMLNYMLNKSLLDRKLFDTVKVLTSHGIQKQYQSSCKAMKRTSVDVDERLWILNDEETLELIQVRQFSGDFEKKADNFGNNHDNSEKKDIKESKVNKSKQKDSKEVNESASPAEAQSTECPFTKIQDLYNNICVSLPRIISIDGDRRKSVTARWRANGQSIEKFEELFKISEASSFLKGNNNSGWTANFDWLMKPSNFTKVLERTYDDRKKECTSESSFDVDEFEEFSLYGPTSRKEST